MDSPDSQPVPRKKRGTLAEMLDEIMPETLHTELDAGPPVGNEER